jgi:hypothetical protein
VKVENPTEWLCPLCYKYCKFGTMGCDDPDTCPEPKNYVYMMRKHFPDGRVTKRGVGISEIANEGQDDR